MYRRETLSQQNVLRILALGFALVVLLVIAAAYVGYQGSKSIHENAQELVRGHFVSSGRGAELEGQIEQQSQQLLDDLEVVLGICLLLAFGCAGVTVYTTRRAFRRLEWQADELDRVSWQMLQDQEALARRFSHEMHDELGQALTGLRSMLKRMDGKDFVENRAECVEILEGALTGVRELSQLLRPVILDDFGLDAGLRWLTERFSERTQITTEYTSYCPRRLTEEQETQLFRIAQEGLTNVARHSGATEVKVRLDTSDDRVVLHIEDNGRGIDRSSQRQPSLGMVGMRARARHVGGEFQTVNRKQGGLRLEVQAPARYAENGETDERAV
ncbi:MAG TPA: sensor histidine kinase [Bryobacteraceae bacterium]|nr:sensor histidine kinase [Bryobacteraceae bacterium]